jgi:parvulin-like peptidyl-prolyl isomerase
MTRAAFGKQSRAARGAAALDRRGVVASIRLKLMNVSRLIPVLAVALGLTLPLRAKLADGVSAVVNDTVITYAQVEEFTAPAADALSRQYAGQPDLFQQKLEAALKDSLDQLIERQLILHEFETKYNKLPESLMDQIVADRIHDRFGDRVTLMKTLQAQGMTYEQFRKSVRDQYIESALRAKNISQAIIISPYKIESYYLAHQDDFKVEDEIKLRMIVLNKPAPDDTNTLKLDREIQSQIKGGTPFAEMAATYSQGSQQHQGGDWGWVQRSVLRKELAEPAFALKTGQVSEPIETPDACYLMLVEQVRPAHVKPLNEVRGEIEKTLKTQEQARLEKEWVDGLKKKNFIRYF